MGWLSRWTRSFDRLRCAGVLGMNQRNYDFVQAWNPRGRFPDVDDKLRTKRLARQFGIRVPGLLAVARYHHQIGPLEELLAAHERFVIKPIRGSGGAGILVVSERTAGGWLTPGGSRVGGEEIGGHVSAILSGLYSLGGREDFAMVERYVESDDALARYAVEGLPDVRVVVYRGVPVMAMTRLPTRAARGKANLHQGAVGVGLDVASGRSRAAVQFDRPVFEHPDTGARLDAIEVPCWEEVLLLAAKAWEVSGLGYVGADIVLDLRRGPVVVELNARPGLGIQIANREGLLERLRAVDARRDPDLLPPEERVELARRLFGRAERGSVAPASSGDDASAREDATAAGETAATETAREGDGPPT